MKRFYHSFEVVILLYLAATSVLVVVRDAPRMWMFLGYHLLGALMLTLGAFAEWRYGGNFWRVWRYWIPIFFILALFRELHHIIPEIHPFEDHVHDAALMRLDMQFFGDVAATVRKLWWPPFVEFLHYCYWSYFPLPAILAYAFWRKGRIAEFRRFGTIYFTGLYIGYLIYMLIPSVGPQHFEPRADELAGAWIGGWMHESLRSMEMITADAFPSLHTMSAGIVLVYAWSRHRLVFWILLIPALGLIAATVVLRYHYLVDVVAGLALVPIAFALGHRLWSGWERREGFPEETK